MSNEMDKTVAKGVGKVAGLGARMKGLRGVFAKLAAQHREATTLLERVHATTDAEKRRDLWLEVRRQLLAHERAELREIYPALETYSSARAIVARHAIQAGQLEATIKLLDSLTMDYSGWQQTLERLIALVKNHAEEEEGDFFVRAQQLLDSSVSAELDDRFARAMERELMELG